MGRAVVNLDDEDALVYAHAARPWGYCELWQCNPTDWGAGEFRR